MNGPGPQGVLVTGTQALVSGATGFLGSRLVPRLLEAGYRVRVLVRPDRRLEADWLDRVETVEGDLRDGPSLDRAVAGQQIVFHTAGRVSDWGRRADFFEINLHGTARLLDSCRRAGVGRLVHLSSLTVLGLPRHRRTITEESPPDPSPRDPYSASKLAAERLLLSSRTDSGPEIVILRPGVIWGPGDRTIVPRLVRLLRQGRLCRIGRADNLLGLSHVDNLVEGVLLAAQCPQAAGQIYHLTDGEEITAHEALTVLARSLGLKPPRCALPFWVLYGIAGVLELAARLTRRPNPPPMTRYGVRLVACDGRYDLSKARRELGYHPALSFAQGMAGLAAAPETP